MASPTLPQLTVDTTDPLSSCERTVDCSSTGGYATTAARLTAFTNALAAAKFKDYIITEPGDTLNGNFALGVPAMSGLGATSGYVVIRPRNLDSNIAIGRRALVADTANMTTLRSATVNGSTSDPVVTVSAGAKYWWLSGLQIIPKASTYTGNIVNFQPVSGAENPSNQTDHMILDRVYIHGDSTLAGNGTGEVALRGVLFGGTYQAAINSTIDDITTKAGGAGDSQAISMAYGAGPLLVTNNFLAASSENVMIETETGETITVTVAANGTDVSTSGSFFYDVAGKSFNVVGSNTVTVASRTSSTAIVLAAPITGVGLPYTGTGYVAYLHAASFFPADITITRNHFKKKLTWLPSDPSFDLLSGTYNVKNWLEFKSGSRVLVEGNVFENMWNAGQPYGLTLTPRYTNSPAGDLTFQYNKVKNCYKVLTVTASEGSGGGGTPPPWLENDRLLVQHNLFENIQAADTSPYAESGGNGDFIALNMYASTGSKNGVAGGSKTLHDFQFLHNTFAGASSSLGYSVFTIGDGESAVGITKADLFIIRDNVLFAKSAGGAGVLRNAFASEGLSGTAALDNYTYNSTAAARSVTKNVIFNTADGGTAFTASTDTGNAFITEANIADVGFADYAGGDYSIPSGTYNNWASDGTDPGADISTLNTMTSGSMTGVWTAPAISTGKRDYCLVRIL